MVSQHFCDFRIAPERWNFQGSPENVVLNAKLDDGCSWIDHVGCFRSYFVQTRQAVQAHRLVFWTKWSRHLESFVSKVPQLLLSALEAVPHAGARWTANSVSFSVSNRTIKLAALLDQSHDSLQWIPVWGPHRGFVNRQNACSCDCSYGRPSGSLWSWLSSLWPWCAAFGVAWCSCLLFLFCCVVAPLPRWLLSPSPSQASLWSSW